ncbi:glycosyltransferase family 39 protein, partial [Streptomyces benahoarensis]|uniref:glycosyltransferase family 39 protein n=1 Tax=Streptomyces benahoarensis TaxID=2595054 RepID=UPI0020365057
MPLAPPARRLRDTVVPVPAVLMCALGAWGLRRDGAMWRDEIVTYDMAHRAPAALWATLRHVDVVHGLYYALMHLWFTAYEAALGPGGLLGPAFGGAVGRTLGEDVVALRLPSLAAMTVAAAGVALLGNLLVGRRTGRWAGIAFALLPPVQQYAQEGRSYALVCALVVWACYLLVRIAVHTRQAPGRSRRALWAGYAALMLTACLLHEFAALVLPVHGAALVLGRLPRRTLRTWALTVTGVLTGLAPLALYSTRQSDQLSWLMWPDPLQLLTFAILAATGIACSRARIRSRGPLGLRALGLPLLLLPTLLLFLLSHAEPAYVDRYVLSYMAGFALLAGAALARLLRPAGEDGQTGTRLRRRALALALAVAALLPVDIRLRMPVSRVDDGTAVAHAVRALAGPGDGLLFTPARRRVWVAAHPDAYRDLHDLALRRDPVASHTLYGTERSGDTVRDRMLTTPTGRLVVVGDGPDQPDDPNDQEIAKRTTLREAFVLCRSRAVHGGRVALYARAEV